MIEAPLGQALPYILALILVLETARALEAVVPCLGLCLQQHLLAVQQLA